MKLMHNSKLNLLAKISDTFHRFSIKKIVKFVFNIFNRLVLSMVGILLIIFILTYILYYFFPKESYFNVASLIVITGIMEVLIWYKSLSLNKDDFKNSLKKNNIKLSKVNKDDIPNNISNDAIIPYSSLLFTAISLLASFLFTNIGMFNKYCITWVFVIFTIIISILFERKIESIYDEFFDKYNKTNNQITLKRLNRLNKIYVKRIQNKISILRFTCKHTSKLNDKKVNRLQHKYALIQVKLKKINRLSR